MPGGLDLFSWSLPFLADKIAEMMDYVLMKNSLVSKKEIKESRKSSVVDFQKIIKELGKNTHGLIGKRWLAMTQCQTISQKN